MLDIKSNIVLKILCKECPNGSYKIVDAGDIISAMPNKYKVDSEGLEHILIYLERQDYISIKYDDDNVYCLAVLPFGFQHCENSTQKDTSKKHPPYIFFLIFFLLSFLACFLANIITKFIP